MPPLLNPKHEQFARLVATGKSLTESFTSVGYSKSNAASCALRLSKKQEVRARILELQEIVTQTAITGAAIDRAWVLSGLRAIAENGVSESAKVRALELCGKELGMFADRRELPWDGDISKLTEEQLTNMDQYFARIAFGGDKEKEAAARARIMKELGAGSIVDTTAESVEDGAVQEKEML